MSVFTSPAASSVTPVVSVAGGLGALSGTCSEWKVERELTGAVLPASSSAFSIGEAEVTVRNPDPLRRAPWARSAADRVRTELRLSLLATDPVTGATWPLGEWITAPMAGDVSSQGVKVNLLEVQATGKRVPALLPPTEFDGPGDGGTHDPSWAVNVLARRMGFFSTPPAHPSALVSAPLIGGWWPESWPAHSTYSEDHHSQAFTEPTYTDDGASVAAMYTFGQWDPGHDPATAGPLLLGHEGWLTLGSTLYASCDATGTFTVQLAGRRYVGDVPVPQVLVTVDTAAGTVEAASSGGGTASGTLAYTPGDGPRRYEVLVSRGGGGSIPLGGTGPAGPVQVRVRGGEAAGPWGPPISVGGIDGEGRSVTDVLLVTHTGIASGFQLTKEPADSLWDFTPNACVRMLGGRVLAPSLAPGTDAWPGVREIVDAHLGLVTVDQAGWLQVYDRHRAVGWDEAADAPTPAAETIDLGSRAATLDWALDPGEVADRLEVTWRPVVRIDREGYNDDYEERIYYSPIAWEADQPIELAPWATVTLVAELDQPAWVAGSWWWGPGATASNGWEINTQPDGSGQSASSWSQMRATSRQLTPTTVEITLQNRTSTRWWTVNPDGTVGLFLRAHPRWDQGVEQVMAWGAPADEAQNVAKLDLGRHVQREDDARELGAWWWQRVSSERPVIDLDLVPNFGRDLAQIVQLDHARSDFSRRALVLSTTLAGRPGQVRQNIRAWLLPVTWHEMAAAAPTRTWADFEDTWAGRTWGDFEADPTRTTPPESDPETGA